MSYEGQLATVLAKADLGDPVDVWTDHSEWFTPFGRVSRTEAVDGELLNPGPVIMARHTSLLQIMGSMGEPPLPTKLRFDEQNRLYLTVTAANGEWTWRLLRSKHVSAYDGYLGFIGRWPD